MRGFTLRMFGDVNDYEKGWFDLCNFPEIDAYMVVDNGTEETSG